MDRNTANVSFYCRESKKNKDGMAPIELSLVINGKRCYVQLLNTHRLLVQEFIHSALDLYIDHASFIINGELYRNFSGNIIFLCDIRIFNMFVHPSGEILYIFSQKRGL